MNRDGSSKQSVSTGDKLMSAITWLTGLLLIIPALINSGLDVYDAIMDIPKGSVEELNEKKRSEHFQKEPLFSHELPISQQNSKKVLKLFVYPNADIYVNYSGYEQWLPSEDMSSTVSINFINSAYAQSSIFGSAKAVVPFSKIREAPDLDSIRRLEIEESKKLNEVIKRSYWFEEAQNEHKGFNRTKRKYSRTFRAIDGYKIQNFTLNIASLNNAEIISSRLSRDKRSLTITFAIRSGPMFDRWRGWIKAEVITEKNIEI